MSSTARWGGKWAVGAWSQVVTDFALRSRTTGIDIVRDLGALVPQELVESEASSAIGAGRYEGKREPAHRAKSARWSWTPNADYGRLR